MVFQFGRKTNIRLPFTFASSVCFSEIKKDSPKAAFSRKGVLIGHFQIQTGNDLLAIQNE